MGCFKDGLFFLKLGFYEPHFTRDGYGVWSNVECQTVHKCSKRCFALLLFVTWQFSARLIGSILNYQIHSG